MPTGGEGHTFRVDIGEVVLTQLGSNGLLIEWWHPGARLPRCRPSLDEERPTVVALEIRLHRGVVGPPVESRPRVEHQRKQVSEPRFGLMCRWMLTR